MPKFHPPHEQYIPEHPSPLGFYCYTASDINDVERDLVDSEAETEKLDWSGISAGAENDGIGQSGVTEWHREQEDKDDIQEDEESPRKRRRIAAPSTEALDDDKAEVVSEDVGAIAETASRSHDDESRATSTSPATSGVSSSFLPLNAERGGRSTASLRHEVLAGSEEEEDGHLIEADDGDPEPISKRARRLVEED